jgi:hypothetical protein
MLRAISLAVATAAFLLWTPAEAQPRTRWIYVTVDAVETDGFRFEITGILQGEATATTEVFFIDSSNQYHRAAAEICHRHAMLALNKPGQFVFEIEPDPNVFGGSPKCKLARATP